MAALRPLRRSEPSLLPAFSASSSSFSSCVRSPEIFFRISSAAFLPCNIAFSIASSAAAALPFRLLGSQSSTLSAISSKYLPTSFISFFKDFGSIEIFESGFNVYLAITGTTFLAAWVTPVLLPNHTAPAVPYFNPAPITAFNTSGLTPAQSFPQVVCSLGRFSSVYSTPDFIISRGVSIISEAPAVPTASAMRAHIIGKLSSAFARNAISWIRPSLFLSAL